MHFALSLVVLAGVVALWASFCVRLGAWYEARREAQDSGAVRARRIPRQRTGPVLPEGHRPPPGLGPLSPSERFLSQESARGLRELQLFLVDQQTA